MKNYKKFTLPIILITIIVLVTLIKNNYLNNKDQICINNNCFVIEIVKTSEEREKGLMNRSSMPLNQAMLFIFKNEDFHSFWMKNTLIPLDIIWINKENKIIHLEHNVQPCKNDPCKTYIPNQKAIYVLEINAGLAKEYNFQLGDIVIARDLNN